MHFAIGETEELLDAYGSSYTSYRLYCNGTFHGTVRYREFFDLHESLRAVYPAAELPAFPPKKLFNLSAAELSGRRHSLEKYMQNLGQSVNILQSPIFQEFMRKIQLRACGEDFDEPGRYSVYLLNGNAVDLTVDPKVSCEELLQLVGQELKLPIELVNFFALFVAVEENGRCTLFKKLAPFEVPFAVVKTNAEEPTPVGGIIGRSTKGSVESATKGIMASSGGLRIVIRKNYWDSSYDSEILESHSRVGTNLLFVEAVDAINRGWTHPTVDQKRHLESLQQKGSRKEFVQVAQSVKGYGSLHFTSGATIDYPSSYTATAPYLSGKDLICPLKVDGQVKQEAVFRVIRMRCWRLCSSSSSETIKIGHSADHPHGHKMSIMFEYLLGRDRLQWITIHSDEAIWISSCLQSMVEELMLQKRGLKVNRPVGGDGSSGKKTGSSADGSKNGTSETLSVIVTTRNMGNGNNSAFEEIRDEDL
ncbi:Sorting nexin-17 [Hypsibius exemplaris]|uniref:Sorting nexin-17 n=1 Tax=Hypsibius exemplaris TaxID=2072580 RepID=A0A1W0WLV9_HYPEX|nr:Sorting nexin-17 [Hypsibius exemplaris]